MLAFAVSTFIDGADLCPVDPVSKTYTGYTIERLIEPAIFQPRFVAANSTGGDFPQITSPAPNDFGEALKRLRQFKSWSSNWDGEGGEKPDRRAIDKAIALLALMASKPISFGIGLDAQARPMFTLRDRRYDGHVVVEPDGTVSFFFQRDNDVLDDYELAFDGKSLPIALDQALSRI